MKRELLDNGNIWQKSDGRWIGMVRYKDEFGVAQRKSFSSKKKKTLQAKMTEYVKNFQEQIANSDESRKPLKESMKNWLRVYKYPEVERTTYDRYECTAEHQIYPYIGNKPVGDVTPADIKKLLTKHMNNGYAFTTSKKAYSLLKMFFKQLYQEGAIPSNPMALIDMTKKDNYLAAQNKESKPQCDLVVVFTDEELEKIKAEAFKRFENGKPVYRQAAAYFLMLNTGLRAGELCGIINSDIDLEHRVIHLQRGVKEVHVRDGLEYVPKLEVKVGKLKSKTSKDNYLAAQNKESKPQCDLVVVFTNEELEKIKEEAFKRFENGKPVYQQAAAYFLMLNTGLRAGELCGVINSDIDLEHRVIHLQRGVKEVHVRDGLEYVPKLEVKVGKRSGNY